MKKFILLLLLFSNKIEAQNVAGMGLNSSLPMTCSVGTATYLTSGTVGLYICLTTNNWTLLSTPSNILPSGTIILKNSGTCPTYWSEVTSLNGVMLRGTLAANGNVGTSSGNDTITPTVNSLTAAAQTFTGNSVTSSAVSGGTPSGTNQALTFTGNVWTAPIISYPVNVPTNSSESAHTHSVTAAGTNGTVSITPLGSNTAITAGTPAGTISALTTGADSSTTGGVAKAIAQTPTFTGSALATHNHTFTGSSTTVGAETFTGSAVTSGAGSSHTHTISWPVNPPTIATYTPAGTINTPTFTGSALGTHTHITTATGSNGTSSVTGSLNSFDNRPAYTNVIFCSKD